MTKSNLVTLDTLLGIWWYSSPKTGIKYYSVYPNHTSFSIRWGNTLADVLPDSKKNGIIIADSQEVYRRILSKARGGYERITDYTHPLAKAQNERALRAFNPQLADEFPSIESELEKEREEARKRKPRIRKVSLLEWLGGKDEYREDGEE